MANLTFQFLDVGQGDGIFVEFPNGKTMLVDMGSTKNKDLTYGSVLAYFKNHTKFTGASRQNLDCLVLTHGDRDHYNMVLQFAKELKVNVLSVLYGGKSTDYGTLIADLSKAQVKDGGPELKVISAPTTFPETLVTPEAGGGVEVEVLMMNAPSPSVSSEAWRKNSSSVVLLLRYGGRAVILSGDATIDTEASILAMMQNDEDIRMEEGSSGTGNGTDDGTGAPDDGTGTAMEEDEREYLKAEVLKVAHHGSARTSIRPRWIEAVSPDYVIISSDRAGALAEEQKPTGHRLPQELCIDLIRDNTDLANDVAKHPYVSSFAPADYTGYTDPDGGYTKGVAHFLT